MYDCENTPMNHQLLNQILVALDNDHNSTVYELFLQTLRSQDTAHSCHGNLLLMRTHGILDMLSEQSNGELEVCASRVATATYHSEIQSLIQLSSGFHFWGSTACLAQLENFSILQMANKIMEVAPNLWHLLGVLLDANPS